MTIEEKVEKIVEKLFKLTTNEELKWKVANTQFGAACVTRLNFNL